MKRMPAGNLTKVIITYKEVSGIKNLGDGNFRVSFSLQLFSSFDHHFQAFWRKAGISGEFVTNGGPSLSSECDRGPLCIVYDGTSAQGNAAIVAFLGGAPAIQWRNQKVAYLIKFNVAQFSARFSNSLIWVFLVYIINLF